MKRTDRESVPARLAAARVGREDPAAPGERLTRGGSWMVGSGYARCGHRLSCYPAHCNADTGFRCVLSEG